MKGNRNCDIGKSCGATCIARRKICKIDLVSEISDGLDRVKEAIPIKEGSGEVVMGPSSEAKEQYQKDFIKHVEGNSINYPTASFQPRDLVNLVVQASNSLQGEAKDNLKRLMEFAIKDGQVLFIATKDDPKGRVKAKDLRRFASLLDQSYPGLKINFEQRIQRIVDMKKELKTKLGQDKEREKEGLLPANKQRTDRLRQDIKRAALELKEARNQIFKPGVTRSEKDGNWGFTNDTSRRVVIMDRSNIPSDRFVKGERADTSLIARQIKETMDFRANTPKLTDDEIYRTKFVVGRFAEGENY